MHLNLQKTEGISRRLYVFNMVLFFLIVLMIFLIYGLLNKPVEKNTAFTDEIIPTNAFSNLDINSKSAYVFDVVQNRAVYKKDEFVQLPLASITKLMTAVTAIESVPSNSKITIKREFLELEGDSGLLANENWSMSDLLDFSLVVSSNDGMRSIASVIGAGNLGTEDYDVGRKDFIQKMNTKAKELELKQTYFINESGLDEGILSGGYGSAIDVAKLMQYMLINHPEILEATKYSNIEISSFDASHNAKNTNTDIGSIPSLIASKTGFTNMAGGNLVIAFDASIGHPFIVVVLGSSLDGRFEDVSKLVSATLEYIKE